jgi:1-acyl-sn-glycerol-3-phosphate acyltransferase
MNKQDNFQDIVPYNDENMKPVLMKLIHEPAFLKLVQSINPMINQEILAAQVKKINTIQGFQKKFISPIVESILHKSVDNLTFSGLENLARDDAYLFISNHRDILLDSTLLNYILLHNGFDSTQMAIGDNLLLQPWISDFFKLNKSFIVKRGLPGRELLKASKKLSNYILRTIQEEKESIWIAQREGRTKDGLDETQQGLLKMLIMAESKRFREILSNLNIVPVAISYEYEPCDKLKAKEIYKRKLDVFKKGPKADLYSMISGIRGQKGNVHIAIGKPLNDEFSKFDSDMHKNDFMKATADLLDKKIYELYRLWNTNYIAHDLLKDNDTYAKNYTVEEKNEFIDYVNNSCESNEEIRPYLLKIYAGPVENRYDSPS